MLAKINPTTTQAWKKLQAHFARTDFDLRTLFLHPERFSNFSVEKENFLFDYSKNLINEETITLLLQLAEECQLKEAIDSMFSGTKINETESRAVLHTALRDFSDDPILIDGKNIKEEIRMVLNQMRDFSEKIISGEHRGFSGKQITDVVNIGIGGSDLGPAMVVSSLKHFKTRLNVHFVSNIDGSHLAETLKALNAETTLFFIASKTFTTQETMTNAASAKDWFLKNGTEYEDIAKHFVAISTNTKAVKNFGIDEENMFRFWDWVGGRYSLWSAIGLSIVLAVGFTRFEELLTGAFNVDQHFRTAKFSENIPVIMGLLGIWYRNFHHAETHAILPYSQYLHRFPAYLQQADMESNGKSVDRNGKFVSYKTGAVLWGEPGTNGQHAFFQLIHQGTAIIPADFIAFTQSADHLSDHQEKLLANFFAQPEALAFGKTETEARTELAKSGMDAATVENLVNHHIFQGNKPTNSLLFKELTPFSLGQLIALYEHKIFVQGVIWNIFSYDQFGVELGKVLAKTILPELKNDHHVTSHDSSTNGLIAYFKRHRL